MAVESGRLSSADPRPAPETAAAVLPGLFAGRPGFSLQKPGDGVTFLGFHLKFRKVAIKPPIAAW
jgi:hypothetical protein